MTGAGKRALAIRHVAFEDLGSLGETLRRRGFEISYLEAGVDDLLGRDAAADDLVVVLGGPIGAYETENYPFLVPEIAFIERRLKVARPVICICLGAQLMARALGARVYPGAAKEIGWSPLSLTAAGAASPLRHLALERTEVLHWHGDTFDLPPGAELLASTALYRHQAFAIGSHALALQFHAEVTAIGLERWFIGHAVEIAGVAGLTVPKLRAETARVAERLAAQGPLCFGAWLDAAGL